MYHPACHLLLCVFEGAKRSALIERQTMAIQVHFAKLNCIETEDTVHTSSHMTQLLHRLRSVG